MKFSLALIILLVVGCGRPSATVTDTRRGDSGYLFVDIQFNGHREGYNITNMLNSEDTLRHQNDSLRGLNGDVGVIYGSNKIINYLNRIDDSLADNKLIQRYCDSFFKYNGIKWYNESNGRDYKEALNNANYYGILLDELDKKWPMPAIKAPKPKDATIYPPKP
jgi:hypothetical protein